MREEYKWDRRDRKRQKKVSGMKVDGRSVFTITEVQRKRAEEVKHDDLVEKE